MKAICWYDKNDVQVEHVPDPTLEFSGCRHQDYMHRYLRLRPASLQRSDSYNEGGRYSGHEFMGEVVEVGHAVKNLLCRRPCGRPISYRLRRMFLLYQ